MNNDNKTNSSIEEIGDSVSEMINLSFKIATTMAKCGLTVAKTISKEINEQVKKSNNS